MDITSCACAPRQRVVWDARLEIT